MSSTAQTSTPAHSSKSASLSLKAASRAIKRPLKALAAGRHQKGQQTRADILDAALALASRIGLEGLSIGALADATGRSKSGVFAHFGSRDELQIAVIGEYHHRFEQEIFYPSMQCARGLPRLQALFEHWMQRTSVEVDSGCIFISGAVDFDDRPGPVRDALLHSVTAWLEALRKAVVLAKDCGHLRPNTDDQQMAFEIHGLILALHYEARFLRLSGAAQRARNAFSELLQRYRAA